MGEITKRGGHTAAGRQDTTVGSVPVTARGEQRACASVWQWLIKRPGLPPVCRGRDVGTTTRVIDAVRDPRDIEILTSYLLIDWSESDSFCKMRTSILEDFRGLGMCRHRADLVQHLDHVLGQLDRGLEYLKLHNPDLDEGFLQAMIYQHRKLRETLLEMNVGAITRRPHSTTTLPCVLTQAVYIVSRATFMCAVPLPGL